MFLRNIIRRRKTANQLATRVLYGGKSGNSRFVAEEACRNVKKTGIRSELWSLNSYPFELLPRETILLIVLSTDGEGEMPPNADKFYRRLTKESPDLSALHYTICALGDSSFDLFCQAGKDLDRRFQELGARRLLNRVDCDADFQQEAAGWLRMVVAELSGGADEATGISLPGASPVYTAKILKKVLLNPGSEREVYHLVLSNDYPVAYEPGDSVRISPANPQRLVDEVLKLCRPETGLEADMLQRQREALLNDYELTSLTMPFLESYCKAGKSRNLASFVLDESWRKNYRAHQDVADLLLDFPTKLTARQLMELLPRMKSRCYSIASSRVNHPGELHLTVRQVRFEHKDRIRYGACSTYLNQWMQVDQQFSFQLATTGHFRLPANSNAPIVMIATGTGIAPFIGFMQQREYQGAKDNWLVFGEQYSAYDFLYQKEILYWKQNGLLAELDLVFSRDGGDKGYVQDLLLEKQDMLDLWIRNGAVLYLCGSSKMGMAVCKTLITIFKNRLNCTDDEARRYVEKLEENGKLLTDLY